MSEPTNGAALLAQIKPQLKEVETEVCLRPDLIEKWNRLDSELAELDQQAGSDRLAGAAGKAKKKKAEEVQAVEAEIVAATVTFRFRAMPVPEFEALRAKHAPRENDPLDSFAGHNREAVEDAMLRECMIEPVFDEKSWPDLLAVLSPSEHAELKNAMREANGGVSGLPKSTRASQVLGKSGSASK